MGGAGWRSVPPQQRSSNLSLLGSGASPTSPSEEKCNKSVFSEERKKTSVIVAMVTFISERDQTEEGKMLCLDESQEGSEDQEPCWAFADR